MDVSIIIINYNTEQLVLNCINSIYQKTTKLNFEIIVVDNDSEQFNLLQNDNRIKFIKSSSNLGFGKANNLAAKYAQGRYLFFLNPDTILLNNAIELLYNFMESPNSQNVGICGGNLYNEQLQPSHSYRILFPGIIYELFFLTKGFPFKFFIKEHFNKTGKSLEVAYITGADLFISKELFNKVKGFDKRFFMYFEETDLCYTIHQLGYRIINIPQSQIVHLEGKSFKLKKTREKLYYQSRRLFFKKHFSHTYYYFCNFIYFFNCLTRVILFFIIGKKHLLQIWGYKLCLFFK